MDWNKIRETRLEGLESAINYYESLVQSDHRLSSIQRKDLAEVSNTVSCFGEYGNYLHEVAQKLLAA